jgi:ElaB/YqjD/DUF883 family membrane-anchored ribosome-binding protein
MTGTVGHRFALLSHIHRHDRNDSQHAPCKSAIGVGCLAVRDDHFKENDMSTSDTFSPNRGGTGLVSPETEQKLRNDFNTAADTAKEAASSIKTEAEQRFGDLKHEAESQIGQATEKVKTLAGEQKDFAAGQLDGVAKAMSKVADELGNSDQASVAVYARDIASNVQRFADTVKNNDVDAIMNMAQDFGRKQPIAFLGAAAVAGLLASRFLLSSSHRATNGSSATPQTYRSFDGDQSNNYRPEEQSQAYGTTQSATQSGYAVDNR